MRRWLFDLLSGHEDKNVAEQDPLPPSLVGWSCDHREGIIAVRIQYDYPRHYDSLFVPDDTTRKSLSGL